MNKSLRRAVIAGNWKMNILPSQTRALVEELMPLVAQANCEVVLCVPYVDLAAAIEAARGSNIKIGAQNCHWAAAGAFTGEISAQMLAELGAEYVILGHSERRQYFGESDATVGKRLRAALDAGLRPILCVGETLEQREQGVTNEVVAMQTTIALGGVTREELDRIVIAYEPVWAIGTGRTASSEEANVVCQSLRGVVSNLYDVEAAHGLSIQYGGSMNAGNARELLGKENVDGGLIGGASLKAQDFAKIVQATQGA